MKEKNISLALAALIMLVLSSCGRDAGPWISLFNGTDLEGWTANGQDGSFYVEDGCIVADGSFSHLFYTGSYLDSRFKNFVLSLEVMTTANANSGVFFHTEFQETGRLLKGYEVQIMNGTAQGTDMVKTGSLHRIRNIYKPLVRDGEWFTLLIEVRGNRIMTYVNGIQTADYTEPLGVERIPDLAGRVLSSGTLALQCHGMGERVYFRDIKVRPLRDDATEPEAHDYFTPEKEALVTHLIGMGYPIIDYHVHLKGGVTIEDIVDKGLRTGVFGSIAPNCGVGFPVDTNEKLDAFFEEYAQVPVFLAMQAEGREWVHTFEKASIARYDYVFTDAMTFTNQDGNRMRLWIDDEVEVGEAEAFMELLVATIEDVLDHEKIDIYVNPTFLPSEIAGRYDELWTVERMERVVDALVRNSIALEINARYRLPGEALIRMARDRGVKFAMGTNNGDHDFANLDYCFEMIEVCGIEPADMFFPRPDGMKPVQAYQLR